MDRRKVCGWLPWAPSGSSTWPGWHRQRAQRCGRDSGSGSPAAPCLMGAETKAMHLNCAYWSSSCCPSLLYHWFHNSLAAYLFPCSEISFVSMSLNRRRFLKHSPYYSTPTSWLTKFVLKHFNGFLCAVYRIKSVRGQETQPEFIHKAHQIIRCTVKCGENAPYSPKN